MTAGDDQRSVCRRCARAVLVPPEVDDGAVFDLVGARGYAGGDDVVTAAPHCGFYGVRNGKLKRVARFLAAARLRADSPAAVDANRAFGLAGSTVSSRATGMASTRSPGELQNQRRQGF